MDLFEITLSIALVAGFLWGAIYIGYEVSTGYRQQKQLNEEYKEAKDRLELVRHLNTEDVQWLTHNEKLAKGNLIDE